MPKFCSCAGEALAKVEGTGPPLFELVTSRFCQRCKLEFAANDGARAGNGIPWREKFDDWRSPDQQHRPVEKRLQEYGAVWENVGQAGPIELGPPSHPSRDDHIPHWRMSGLGRVFCGICYASPAPGEVAWIEDADQEPPPLVAGGQGRSARSVFDSGVVLTIWALILIGVMFVIGLVR